MPIPTRANVFGSKFSVRRPSESYSIQRVYVSDAAVCDCVTVAISPVAKRVTTVVVTASAGSLAENRVVLTGTPRPSATTSA